MFIHISEEEQKRNEENLDEWWNALSGMDKYHIHRFISEMNTSSVHKADMIVSEYKKKKFWEKQEVMDKAFEENKQE